MQEMETLIHLVHDRPILWDRSLETYKDRRLTRKAWLEIFTQLRSDYREMAEKERMEFGKNIMKKWANIRDSFRRSHRVHKSSIRSGSPSRRHRSYIYSQHLQFLKKTLAESPSQDRHTIDLTNNSGSDNAEVVDEDLEEEHLQDDDNTLEEQVPRSKSPNPKKRKPGQVELELIRTLKRKPDRHMSFFQGIIPSLEMFDDDEVVEFQLKVMQLVSEIKQRKKSSEHKPACSAHQEYQDIFTPRTVWN